MLLILLDPDNERHVDMVGESLREHFFDQSKGFGGYSTMDVNSWIEGRPNIPVSGEYNEGFEWQVFYSPVFDVTMYIYWDGDGSLVFELPNGNQLWNTDCKKDYGWEHNPKWGEL